MKFKVDKQAAGGYSKFTNTPCAFIGAGLFYG